MMSQKHFETFLETLEPVLAQCAQPKPCPKYIHGAYKHSFPGSSPAFFTHCTKNVQYVTGRNLRQSCDVVALVMFAVCIATVGLVNRVQSSPVHSPVQS